MVHEESDTTERLHFHFSLSCTGEGNGNPLQCSCLENPRDRGAWWAAVYAVAQSQTRLKRLSSSSSNAAFPILRFERLLGNRMPGSHQQALLTSRRLPHVAEPSAGKVLESLEEPVRAGEGAHLRGQAWASIGKPREGACVLHSCSHSETCFFVFPIFVRVGIILGTNQEMYFSKASLLLIKHHLKQV